MRITHNTEMMRIEKKMDAKVYTRIMTLRVADIAVSKKYEHTHTHTANSLPNL